MSRSVPILAVAAATTAAVGLLDGAGWPSFAIGAILALALWVMLFADGAGRGEARVAPRAYAAASVVAVAVGWALATTTDNRAWWSVGFILSGALTATGSRVRR